LRSVLLTVLALGFFASPACAWNEAGHKMTAVIAFDLLGESDQQEFATILRAHPRFKEDFIGRMPAEIANAAEREQAPWIFSQASIWPDIIQNKSEEIRRQYHRSTWHYINLPVYLTDEDEQEFAGKPDHNVATEFAVPLRKGLNLIQALQGNLLLWRDETAPDSQRAVALCWFLHLAGDIHEPLHNVALFSRTLFPDGDRGGNLITVKSGNDSFNFHAVWDGLANRLDDYSLDENTKNMLANDVADIQAIGDWARDHHRLAMEYAYTEEVKRQLLGQDSRGRYPQITLSMEYLATAEELARTRIIIAGHRIAALLTN
jgi:hypothetical protein